MCQTRSCIELMMTWYKYGGGFTHMRGRLFENCQKYPRYKVSITLKISKNPNPNLWSVKNIMISRLNFRFTLYYWGKFGGPKITIFRIKFSNVVERNVRHFVMNDLYLVYLVADKLKLQLCQIQKCIFYLLSWIRVSINNFRIVMHGLYFDANSKCVKSSRMQW